MASFIRLSPADCVDGISATLIPASATTTVVSGVRFTPATEMARWRFTCTGTQFSVQVGRDGPTSGVNSNPNAILAYVDGVYFQQTPTLNAVSWLTFSGLSNGPHTVEISNGQGGVSGSKMVGNAILAISGTNVALAPVSSSRRLVLFGDSEMCASSTLLGVTDVGSLLRSVYPGRVSFGESMGGATATQWSNIPSLTSRLIRHAAGAGVVDFAYWLGVNDYIGQTASIQTVVTNHLNAMLAVPGCNRIVVMTPVPKSTETGTRTLTQYRADVTAAVAAVSSPKIVLIDGTSIGLSLATDYVDGLHQNDAGCLKSFAALRTGLGI
jgi:hypothetical protein